MMKKSQILAAIALAMALGVVAPVVSAENASAAVVEGKTNAQYVQAEKDAIEAKFGTVKVYDDNGVTTSYKAGYAYYGTVAGQIGAANGVITTAKGTAVGTLAGASKTAGVHKVLANAVTATVFSKDDLTKITTATGWGTDYDKTVELVKGAKTKLNAIKSDTTGRYTTAQVAAAETAVNAIDSALAKAANSLDAAVNTAHTTNAITDIVDTVKELTNETIADPTTVAELNAAIAKIEGKLPQMAAYRRVDKAFTDAAGINIADLIDRQVKELVDAYWAAYNGTTPDKTIDQIVDENKNNGTKAPATGIAGTAEGTATTVSIVAGLATALTALGAGVVAYRSARRK